MTHRDAWEKLDAFLDGSLAAGDRWAVITHVDDCATCRKHPASQARLRGAARDHLPATGIPPGLTRRLQSALAAEPAPRMADRESPWWLLTAARCAKVLAPALIALWLVVQTTGLLDRPLLAAQGDFAVSHALFAQDEEMLDIAGDGHAVAAWFRDHVGLAVVAPPIEGFEVIGGRLIAFDGKPVAQIVYESHPDEVYLSLARFPDPDPDRVRWRAEDLASGQRGTISTISWPEGPNRVMLVSEVPAPELRRLAGNLIATIDGRPSES